MGLGIGVEDFEVVEIVEVDRTEFGDGTAIFERGGVHILYLFTKLFALLLWKKDKEHDRNKRM